MRTQPHPVLDGSPELSARDVVEMDLAYIGERLDGAFGQMAGRRLLITGGGGFLGHYLVQSALWWNRSAEPARRIDVTVYDNWIRGFPDWLRALDQPELSLFEYDLARPLPPDMGHFDYIIHAASIASPTYYRQHPIETMDGNVNGLRALLSYCLEQEEAGTPVRAMLFFSSSEVYGDPDPAHIPTPESYNGNVSFTGPRACYDEAKRYGETLCVNFAGVHGTPIKVARPFNNYGPGLRLEDRRVLPDFARDVLLDRPIRLLSDGSPTRTFCYVADAVIGYYRVLLDGRPGEAYNIGVERPEISMVELAERTAALGRDLFGYSGHVAVGSSSDPAYLTDNPQRRCPSIEKAREELGYDPAVDLDDGLRRSLIWYSAQTIDS